MKISKYFLLALCLTVVIFFIPFFWLRPGEMDLGGDNSRLYFYDPIGYLVSQSLYSVSHSGFGGENLSYYAIPFFLLLAFVKSLVSSPTILISVLHGLNLSGGFFSCYLIVRELLKSEDEKKEKRQFISETASILAGFYYTFSLNPIHWWGYPLLPMNLVFLNPLLFFILLRFFLTHKTWYLLLVLLITFFFSPNFSYIGAPTFFSFFPLAVLFLVLYVKYIRKKKIPWKKSLIGLLFFVGLHAFHLIPQITSILTPGTFANEFIFGDQGKLQWGLNYFLATAPSIKVSYALLGLLQYSRAEFYWWLFMVFPLMFVFGFLWSRSRLYLLSGIFFLITLFFVSANITSLGLTLYALAFQLPGFPMFRVFYGQWQWAYLFFYTLLIGQALATVMGKIKPMHRYFLIGFLVSLLAVTSWPFISGKLTDTILWQSKDIRSHIKMDPAYDEVLSFIRSLPVDGKILSLPVNDHGYQVLKGENDAAYVGPSTITYLAARNEFTSIAEFGVFGSSILTAAVERNYTMFKDILILFNVKYIFYNEDPYIYGDNFPGLPYTRASKFFPDTQVGYKEFIKDLGIKEIKTIAGKYHIYEIDNTSSLPHIYTAKKIAYWSDALPVNLHAPLSFYPEDKRVALYDDNKIFKKYTELFDDIFLKAKNTSSIFDFFKTKKRDKFVSPTISKALSSFLYPLVVLREKRDLRQYTQIDDAYIDRSIYFAEKRVNELFELKDIPLLKNVRSITELGSSWKDPELWEFTKYKEYNSWEITLVRYQKAVEKLINELEQTNQSAYSTTISKVQLKEYLKEHKAKLRSAIRQNSSWSTEDRQYASSLVERMFSDIYTKLSLILPEVNVLPYVLEHPDDGTYEVYVNKKDIANLDISLSIDGKSLPQRFSQFSEWVRFEDVVATQASTVPFTLDIKTVPNLVAQTHWKTAELTTWVVEQEVNGQLDPVTLLIPYNVLDDTSGLVRDISGWEQDSIYTISFDYITYDQNFSLVIHEEGGTKNHKYSNDIYAETFRSKDWKKFGAAVLSSKDARYATLHVVKAQDDHEYSEVKKISIRNLSIQKIYNPQIIFKKITAPRDLIIPKITFSQINPSKYKVTVENATDPYALVFLQQFHHQWKLFFPSRDNEAKTIKGVFAKFVGTILQTFTKIFINTPSRENVTTIASYANGLINEETHTRTFWDKDTFETWGQDPIAEATHLPVNSYANAWYIRPEDVANQTNYTLIIEMTPQKLFYGSLALSVGTFCLVVLMFLKSFIPTSKQKN